MLYRSIRVLYRFFRQYNLNSKGVLISQKQNVTNTNKLQKNSKGATQKSQFCMLLYKNLSVHAHTTKFKPRSFLVPRYINQQPLYLHIDRTLAYSRICAVHNNTKVAKNPRFFIENDIESVLFIRQHGLNFQE